MTLSFARILLGSALVVVTAPVSAVRAATLSGNASVTFQTMTGWEATADAGQFDSPAFGLYKDELFDRAVDELGINRIRLEIRSGVEHTTDNWARYRAGTIDEATWRTLRYQSINDDASTATTNAAGFHFTEMDATIEAVVNPLRQRLAARGKQLSVTLNLVDFNTSTETAFQHKTNPAEYAELMSAAFQHIQTKYGWTPTNVEVLLEPNNTSFTATQLANALVATGDRLKSEGFAPKFIAPSNSRVTGTGGAITWYNNMKAANPRIFEYLSEYAYHRYDSTITDTHLTTIATEAAAQGIKTAMLEHIGSGYVDLHADLKTANVSAWEQFVLAFPLGDGVTDNGAQYYLIDDSNPNDPNVTMGSRTKLLAQYFRNIDMGAVRIGGTSDSAAFDPLFFVNPAGDWTVIVKQTAAGPVNITGLPAGTYEIGYAATNGTTGTYGQYTILDGQTLSYNSTFTTGVTSVYLVPEPGAMMLLGGAGLLLARRRR